jgi:hypothetical protein
VKPESVALPTFSFFSTTRSNLNNPPLTFSLTFLNSCAILPYEYPVGVLTRAHCYSIPPASPANPRIFFLFRFFLTLYKSISANSNLSNPPLSLFLILFHS